MFTQKDILERGTEDIIEKENLKKKLKSGKKLRVKFGIDPTAPDIHLGHTVPLWKLRQFQELGHTAVLIVGDFTATIGDPSGQDKARKVLDKAEVKKNMRGYIKQIEKILDIKKTEIYYNSEWHAKEGLEKLLMLARNVTIHQLFKRAAFKERMKKGGDTSVIEFFYPMLQAYDSVKVKADVEIGGTDQIFNLLMGRQIQKRFGQREQDIITLPLLLGTDGVKKMSKSFNNYIAISDRPEIMFGKIMSIADVEIVQYFELATPLSLEELQKIKKQKITGKIARDLKLYLARTVVGIYWGEKKAIGAQKKFETQFQKQVIPKNISTYKTKARNTILELLVETKFAKSKNEARRFIQQGGVYIDDKKLNNFGLMPKRPFTLRVGRRKIIKII